MTNKKERRMMPPEYKAFGSPGGVVRFMAEAEGYVMVRRPSRVPFIVPAKDWAAWAAITGPEGVE